MMDEQRKLTQLESTAGVRQGDPLGAMLFAMALQRVLKKLPWHAGGGVARACLCWEV
jgi:hypothetical protein